MKKNPYKKHLELMVKNYTNIKMKIERVDDQYYICDGISILRLPYIYYDIYAKPVNAMYVELENGESITYPSNGDPGKKEHGNLDISTVFKKYNPNKEIEITQFLIEDTIAKRKVRIAICAGHITCVNDAYIQAAKDYAGHFFSEGSNKALMFSDDLVGCMIAPIHSAKYKTSFGRLRNALELGECL